MPEVPGATPALRVRLRLSPPLREVLADVVGGVLAARAAAPDAVPFPPAKPGEAPDVELQAAWAESLFEREDYDQRALSDLVRNPQFGAVDLLVAPAVAEALMRACVRVRLHLRETVLQPFSTADLDEGLKLMRLPPAEQRGYICYCLFADLQQDLLLQLDPGLSGR